MKKNDFVFLLVTLLVVLILIAASIFIGMKIDQQKKVTWEEDYGMIVAKKYEIPYLSEDKVVYEIGNGNLCRDQKDFYLISFDGSSSQSGKISCGSREPYTVSLGYSSVDYEHPNIDFYSWTASYAGKWDGGEPSPGEVYEDS